MLRRESGETISRRLHGGFTFLCRDHLVADQALQVMCVGVRAAWNAYRGATGRWWARKIATPSAPRCRRLDRIAPMGPKIHTAGLRCAAG